VPFIRAEKGKTFLRLGKEKREEERNLKKSIGRKKEGEILCFAVKSTEGKDTSVPLGGKKQVHS